MIKKVVRVKPTQTGRNRTVLSESRYVGSSEHDLRKQLATQLNELIKQRRLTQAESASILGVPQPHVSELKNYKLSRFSSERLMRFLTLLDRDVHIVITRKMKGGSVGDMYVIAR